MRGRELILTTGVVFSLSLVVSAGGIIEWNSEKTSGIWSDGANWIGNVAPTAEDAAKFTVGAEGEIVVSVEEDATLADLWIYGGGKVKLQKGGDGEEAPLISLTGNSTSVAPNVGSGRQSVLVSGGTTLTVDGIKLANTSTGTYHDLQMNGGSTLVVTNGADVTIPVRVPATGFGAVANDTFTIIVTGEGSVLRKGTGSTQIHGTNGKVICRDGGKVIDQMSWNSSPESLVYSFTNNASFMLNATLTPGGVNNKLILDDNSTGESSNSLETDDSLTNFEFLIDNGSTFKTTSFRWGKKLAHDNTVIVGKDSTLRITGYVTFGANKGSETNHAKNNSVIVRKDGLLNCGTAPQEFDFGLHSENDLLYLDGGKLTSGRTTRIGSSDFIGSAFKLRGETAEATFTGVLSFGTGVTLATELPLPADRPLMTSSQAVTINPGVKFEVTLPDGFQKGTYTILTAKSIAGTIAEDDIVVKGKGTCSLTQDGSSICMTVKPTAGGLIVIVQ